MLPAALSAARCTDNSIEIILIQFQYPLVTAEVAEEPDFQLYVVTSRYNERFALGAINLANGTALLT